MLSAHHLSQIRPKATIMNTKKVPMLIMSARSAKSVNMAMPALGKPMAHVATQGVWRQAPTCATERGNHIELLEPQHCGSHMSWRQGISNMQGQTVHAGPCGNRGIDSRKQAYQREEGRQHALPSRSHQHARCIHRCSMAMV
jgi:hypothetical protein